MHELTHLSLFSGIGGLDLAAEWAGFTSVGQCEWAPYPTAILEKHWPDVPRWRDIRTLTKESFYERTGLRTVDVISGGFPCQPFSVAGKRRGKEDDRYLWPEMLRVISEIRPTWVVGENVAGIVNMALDTVLSDLEAIGYACQTLIIPACAVDAPHRRDRCAILAYGMCNRSTTGFADTQRREEGQTTEPINSGAPLAYANCIGSREKSYQSNSDKKWDNSPQKQGRGAELCEVGYCCSTVLDTASQRLSDWESGEISRPKQIEESKRPDRRTAQPGLGGVVDGISYWLDEPPGVPRVATGIKKRVDRLNCLGNAVVPQQFYPIFKAIADIERSNNGT